MTVLREDQFDQFLAKGLARMNGLLIHGDDTSAAESFAARIAREVSGADGEAPVRLDGSSLSGNGGRLDDEFRSISLLGGRRAIIVTGATELGLKAISPLLQNSSLGNFVVITSGSLTKSSKLRDAVEKSDRFAALALYEAKAEDLARRVQGIWAADGLVARPEALERFFELVGNDRMIVEQEASKLAVFVLGQQEIGINDVEAVCGDVSSTSISVLLDDVLSGNTAAIEAATDLNDDDGAGLKGALPLLSWQVGQLQAMAAERASGKSVDQAIAAARPPVHFTRKKAISNLLQRHDLAAIERIQTMLEQATLASRKSPALAGSIVSRTLMTISREAREIKAR